MKLSATFHGSLSLNQQKKFTNIKTNAISLFRWLNIHIFWRQTWYSYSIWNKIWDIHALIPIIRAAGGIVTTWKNYDARKAGNIICSANKSLHNKILKILKPVSN